MITGFNTDVEHEDRVYHVQTEDKGADNPVVESLVYCGGEIVESRRNSYADLAVDGRFPEDEVLLRMEAQHQTMVREIRNGKFDVEGPKPFGHAIISNRSLDEVVLEFLCAENALDGLTVELVDEQVLLQGTRPTLRVKVCEPASQRPVAGAQVDFKLVTTQDQPRDLCRAVSDIDGFLEASFEIPEMPGADMAVLCQARAVNLRAELRQLVHRAAHPSQGRPAAKTH